MIGDDSRYFNVRLTGATPLLKGIFDSFFSDLEICGNLSNLILVWATTQKTINYRSMAHTNEVLPKF